MEAQIRNVIVLGASGSVGPTIVDALVKAGFNVTVLSRESSTKTFPCGIKVIRTDYTRKSLVSAFINQDTVISAISSVSTQMQISLIDAAIEAGVRRFIPSEYGIGWFPVSRNLGHILTQF
jgi:putative NADH-flavin reductase